MSTDLMNISAFKGLAPAQAFQVLDPQSESLADGIGSSYGIIGYKGKNWTLRLRGETYDFKRPDDGTPAPFLDVIVLRQLPNKSKSYYPANTYADGAIGTRPVCSALDGLTPDADILTPQSNACAICPRNVFKISPDGRKTRECSDYKRLAVLILPSLTKALLGAPLMEPVFLRVPAASLNELALLGEGMAAQGFHFSSYITRIGFKPDKPHPQMTFRALQGLTDREAPVVLPLRDDPTSLRITGEGEINKPRAALAGAPSTVQQAPQTTAAPSNVVQMQQPDPAIAAAALAERQRQSAAAAEAQRAAAAAEAQRVADAAEAAAAARVDTGFGDVTATVNPAPVQQVQQPVQAQVQAATVETGFGDIGGAGATLVQVAQPTVNTVSDTGEPEVSDTDLDARVALLLK